MTQPLVTIVMPCYNAARWLPAAVRSALAQVGVRREIILVDDGSTDESLSVARAFAGPDVRVLAQANRGASAARNAGVAAAQGDYIQFLDADDLLHPNKLQSQIASQVESESTVLTFGSMVPFSDGDPPEAGTVHPAALPPSGGNPVEFVLDLLGGNGRGWMVQTSQWLLPRSLATQAGAWNESLSVDDDGEYFCRVMLSASRIAAIPESICYYRHHRGGENLSVQSRLSPRGARSLLESTRLKGRHLHKHTSDSRINRALAGSYNGLVLSSYPNAPDVSREALRELGLLGYELDPGGGTAWFERLRRLGGWKFARRAQHLAQAVRNTFRR